MTVRYDDAAIEEAMEAAAWYEAQHEDLLKRFLAKWKVAENQVAADPRINRSFDGELRLRRFGVFPFALIYRIEDKATVQVVAVMHQSRRPGYWKGR